MWRSPGPHVKWAGVVVKLDDGTTHAVEFGDGGFITADLHLPNFAQQQQWGYGMSVWIQGRGRHWQEGADMGPNVTQRELPAGRSEIESGN